MKFDHMTTQKSILRDQISGMQSQKEAFLKIHGTLQQKLEHIKTMKKRVTKGTLAAQEEREAMLARVQVLKERTTTAIHQYDFEVEKLSRMYDHDQKLGTFFSTKSADRSGHEDRKKRLEAIGKAREKTSRESCEIIRQYQDTCEKMFTLTGQKDLDALAEQSIENEIKNFGSFTLVKELIFDVQGAEETVQAIKNEITTLQKQHMQMASQQDAAKKLLEEQILKTSQEANGYENQFTEKYQHLQQIFSSLQSLFNTIKCDPESLEINLAAEAFAYLHCTKYFCEIEKRIDELLQMNNYHAINEPTEEELSPVSSQLQLTSSTSNLFDVKSDTKITLSNIEDDTEATDDADGKVFSYMELRNKTLQDIGQQEQKAATKAQKMNERNTKKEPV